MTVSFFSDKLLEDVILKIGSGSMTLFGFVMICVAGFFAAFVDSMVGGGGMISIPALMATGIPTHLALGTNKFAASSGSISSVYHYFKSGTLEKKILLPLLPLSLIGSALGVLAVLAINPNFLKVLIIVLVSIMIVYNLLNKNLGMVDTYESHTSHDQLKAQGFTFTIGFYDGFFGPGTGSFFIIMLIHIFKVDFKRAAANAKTLNLASNIAALVVFAFSGQIYFLIGIPMAISMILGAKVGTRFALKKGAKWIKPIFNVVSISLVLKLLIEGL